jgi:hypothetical protein
VDPKVYTISTGNHGVTGTAVKDQWIYVGVIQPGAANPLFINESFRMNETVTNWAQLTNMTFTVNFYAQQTQGTPQPSAPSGQLAGHTR